MFNDISYFHQACQNIVDNQDQKAVNYAVVRAFSGLTETDKGRAHARALRLIGDIPRWRGPVAEETRSILKNIIKHWEEYDNGPYA